MSLINSVKYYFTASKFNELGNIYIVSCDVEKKRVIIGAYNDELIAIARALKHAGGIGDVGARLIADRYAVHKLIVGGEVESHLNPVYGSQTPENLKTIYEAITK